MRLSARGVLGAAVLSVMAAAPLAVQAQEASPAASQEQPQEQAQPQAGSVGAALSTLRADREAAEARDSARLAGLIDDSEALSAALDKAQADLAAARERRESLEARQQELSATLDALNAERDAQGGDLAGVFASVAAEGGELRDDLANSWLTVGARADLPERLGDDEIVTLDQIERLADSLMGLTAETARVVSLDAPVAAADGRVASRPVTRIGDQLAFSDGQLLERVGEEGRLAVIEHTPGIVAERLNAFSAGDSSVVPVDPAEGRVLQALALQPTLWQRFQQGGAVGWVVVALGALGLVIALGQYLYLLRVSMTTRRQLADLDNLRADNPLGRVLIRFHAFGAGHAPEALEARLDEAMLAEQPRIERGQALVKMLAAVAPLLGLLGTVTGMIVTFQSITVFGTGDPQLMAGGISQALVTTVLGLITAVPLLFAHTALSARSRALIGTMEGRASAVLADRLEADRAPSTSPSEARHHADALA